MVLRRELIFGVKSLTGQEMIRTSAQAEVLGLSRSQSG